MRVGQKLLTLPSGQRGTVKAIHVFAKEGAYSVRLEVTDQAGQTDTVTNSNGETTVVPKKATFGSVSSGGLY